MGNRKNQMAKVGNGMQAEKQNKSYEEIKSTCSLFYAHLTTRRGAPLTTGK